MKKLLAFLLACTLVLSLAACGGSGSGGGAGGAGGGGDHSGGDGGATSGPASPGETPPAEGYDAEYTIYVNGSDEWTPFPGKSGVSFTVSDDKVISVSESGTKISFTGKQVGESIITATLDGAEANALVRVREMEKEMETEKEPTEINYHYDPPEDFMFICATYDKGGSYGDDDTFLNACLAGSSVESYEGMAWRDILYYYPGTPTPSYVKESGMGWERDQEWDADISQQRPSTIREDPYPLNAFYKDFVEHSGYDPGDYYAGIESVLDIDCWVFDLSALNPGHAYRYWVNPENGHTLKLEKHYADNDETVVKELIEYNPELEEWPAGWGLSTVN